MVGSVEALASITPLRRMPGEGTRGMVWVGGLRGTDSSDGMTAQRLVSAKLLPQSDLKTRP